MEDDSILKKIQLKIGHLPTVMLMIGYAVFWLELFSKDTSGGLTSNLAWLAFVFVSIFVVFQNRMLILKSIRIFSDQFKSISKFEKVVILLCCFACLFILSVSLQVSFLPPHLPQEYDAINYHITIPRQHLIQNTFSYLSWSSADLYFMPVGVALSPYWLSTELPNKIPQIFFAIGLIAVSLSIFSHFQKDNILGKMFLVFSILGSHNISIQMGIAMLDIAICYLFFATVDSLLKRNYFIAMVEFSFCFWAKSFMPIMFTLLFLGMNIIVCVLNKSGLKDKTLLGTSFNSLVPNGKSKLLIWYFLAISIFIGGPFIAKSIDVTGSPLFPFFVGDVNLSPSLDVRSDQFAQIKETSERILQTKDQYGSGRGPLEFIKHLWLISVPEKAVNNRYDYPVGLPYLLCLGPFVFMIFRNIRRKSIEIGIIFVLVYWGLWWMGSQQTRFMYMPIICMFMVVLSDKKWISNTFISGILLSLLLVSLSVFRAHKSDFSKSPYEVLRQKDIKLLEIAKNYKGTEPVRIGFEDAAFASFPIIPTNYRSSVFVLKTE